MVGDWGGAIFPGTQAQHRPLVGPGVPPRHDPEWA